MGYLSSGGMSDGGDVKMRFSRRRAKTADGPADDPPAWSNPPRLADRSCCCPARPAVRVLIPPGPARPYPADLLLCGHHYLASRPALAAVGAAVIDETGIMADPVLAGCRGIRE
jgi:hypothetical protein